MHTVHDPTRFVLTREETTSHKRSLLSLFTFPSGSERGHDEGTSSLGPGPSTHHPSISHPGSDLGPSVSHHRVFIASVEVYTRGVVRWMPFSHCNHLCDILYSQPSPVPESRDHWDEVSDTDRIKGKFLLKHDDGINSMTDL